MWVYPWRKHRFYCEHLWTRVSVLADGTIEPCSCALSKHEPFAFKPGQLQKTWNNDWFRRTRRHLIQSRRCPEMRMAGVEDIFDCCAKCPVAPQQRYQSPREYYSILAHAAGLGGALRNKKLDNLKHLLSQVNHARDRIDAMPAWANIDPANRCNLRCPECHVGRGEISRPPRLMDLATFDAIMEEIGPTLMFMELYRYGEPLINQETPAMIEHAARRHGIATRLSTNFSLALSDEQLDGLVTSGLKQLVIAADDVEQGDYEKYRRGGRIEVVADNLRRLAAIRKRRHSRYPRIVWQALKFKFNEGRVDEIAATVRGWGADRFVMLPAYISGENLELAPSNGVRRGRENSRLRPHPIVSANCEPEAVPPGSSFRLTVTLRNDVPGRSLPAEHDGEPHPVRIGVRLVNGDGAHVCDLGRIRIDRSLASGQQGTFSGTVQFPSDPNILAQADAIQIDLVAEFLFWFEDQIDIQTVPFKLKVTPNCSAYHIS